MSFILLFMVINNFLNVEKKLRGLMIIKF